MDMVQQILKGFQRILGFSLHFLEKGMDFQEFEERLWETMNSVGKDILRVVLEAKDEEIHRERDRNAFQVVRRSDQRTILTLFGDVTYRRTYYRKKNTREYRYLLDDQIGFGKKKRIDPLLEALVLERATELSYHKAGRNVLPQNQECTVNPEVVKRLVHNLRKDEEKEGKDFEEEAETSKEEAPRPLHRGRLMHVPLQEKRRGGKGRKKKSRILAKLVYVHEGKEVSSSGRVELKNPHYFARRYEDTEASSRSSSTWRRIMTSTLWKPSSSVVMVPPGSRKAWRSFPNPSSSSLASTWHRESREHALNLIKEGNSGKLSRRVPGRKSKPCSSRPSPGVRIPETKEALKTSTSTSPVTGRESRMPGTIESWNCESVPKLMAAYPFSSTLPSSHGLGEERGRPYELPPSFEVQQVLSAALLPENPKAEISSLHPFP